MTVVADQNDGVTHPATGCCGLFRLLLYPHAYHLPQKPLSNNILYGVLPEVGTRNFRRRRVNFYEGAAWSDGSGGGDESVGQRIFDQVRRRFQFQVFHDLTFVEFNGSW